MTFLGVQVDYLGTTHTLSSLQTGIRSILGSIKVTFYRIIAELLFLILQTQLECFPEYMKLEILTCIAKGIS